MSSERRPLVAGALSSLLGGRLVLWVALFAAIVGLLAVATFDDGGLETDAERVQRLSDSFACPECQGESVSESNAAVAANIRDRIRVLVGEGASDQEIRDELLQGYGTRILLNPPAEGLASLLWILPVVLLVGGAAGIAHLLSRSRAPGRLASDDDHELVAQARSASPPETSDESSSPSGDNGDSEQAGLEG